MTRYAIVLTHNRPEMLLRCVRAIAPQVDCVMVVDNASDPPVRIGPEEWPLNTMLYQDPSQPPNLAKLWNRQLDVIARRETSAAAWEVAMLCDDSIVPLDWFRIVSDGMRAHRAVAGSTGPLGPRNDYLLQTQLTENVYERMCGWAFMLAGEKGLRADDSMHWWFCDSDLDWTARQNGGMVICPGPSVPNELPGHWTNAKPELGTQAGLDREAFRVKWGQCPW